MRIVLLRLWEVQKRKAAGKRIPDGMDLAKEAELIRRAISQFPTIGDGPGLLIHDLPPEPSEVSA